MVIEPVVACIETKDLNKMEHYIFFSGAILALILFLGSMWLVMVFPNFIKQSVSPLSSSFYQPRRIPFSFERIL